MGRDPPSPMRPEHGSHTALRAGWRDRRHGRAWRVKHDIKTPLPRPKCTTRPICSGRLMVSCGAFLGGAFRLLPPPPPPPLLLLLHPENPPPPLPPRPLLPLLRRLVGEGDAGGMAFFCWPLPSTPLDDGGGFPDEGSSRNGLPLPAAGFPARQTMTAPRLTGAVEPRYDGGSPTHGADPSGIDGRIVVADGRTPGQGSPLYCTRSVTIEGPPTLTVPMPYPARHHCFHPHDLIICNQSKSSQPSRDYRPDPYFPSHQRAHTDMFFTQALLVVFKTTGGKAWNPSVRRSEGTPFALLCAHPTQGISSSDFCLSNIPFYPSAHNCTSASTRQSSPAVAPAAPLPMHALHGAEGWPDPEPTCMRDAHLHGKKRQPYFYAHEHLWGGRSAACGSALTWVFVEGGGHVSSVPSQLSEAW